MKLPALPPARLQRRYTRFLADVTLEDGSATTVHCPNPGSMMGLKEEGSRVWLSASDNPRRKLSHTLEIVEADGALIGINTNHPNKLAEEAIKAGKIRELADFAGFAREVPYGSNSRVDILLETETGPIFVEVKNCHLMREKGLAEFPDSVTTRGAKHLLDLADEVRRGAKAVMLFIIQRPDCEVFDTARDLDPAYHEGLRAAADAGVDVLCYDCHVDLESIEVRRSIPWRRS